MNDRNGLVIVTGASGRIGAAVAGRLAARYRVVAFDRAGPPTPPPGIETIDVDLTSDEGVRSAFRECAERHGREVASILHFAAYYDFTGEPDPRYDEINVEGTARLIRSPREAGLRAERFVYASTMVVHTPSTPGTPISETSTTGPTMPYSRSKLAAEEGLRATRGETPLLILRLANVYDDLVHHPVLAQQFRRAFERTPGHQFFPGDSSHGQSYLHMEDLLDAIDRAVDRRATLLPDLTLLLGEPGALAYGAIHRELGRLFHGEGSSPRRVPKFLARVGLGLLKFSPVELDPFLRPWMVDRADDHYELDVSRAGATLGWTPSRSLLGSLPEMAGDLLRDPLAWYQANDLDPPKRVQSPAAATAKTTPR